MGWGLAGGVLRSRPARACTEDDHVTGMETWHLGPVKEDWLPS